MPALSGTSQLHRIHQRSSEEMRTIDNVRRREKQRAEFIEYLTRRHAERLDLPLHIARERVVQVAVSARRRDDEAAEV